MVRVYPACPHLYVEWTSRNLAPNPESPVAVHTQSILYRTTLQRYGLHTDFLVLRGDRVLLFTPHPTPFQSMVLFSPHTVPRCCRCGVWLASQHDAALPNSTLYRLSSCWGLYGTRNFVYLYGVPTLSAGVPSRLYGLGDFVCE